MTYHIVGLGNPVGEYEMTRHNTGEFVLRTVAKSLEASDWKDEKKKKAIVASAEVGKHKVVFVLPQTFMNKSGDAVKMFVKTPKDASRTVVVYDDLDLPIGSMKISFNRGSGGHKGLESVARSLKTKEFIRIRVGISPLGAKGKAKKPQGDKAVGDFILGKWKPSEEKELKKVSKQVAEAVEVIVKDGLLIGMNKFN